MPTIKTIAAALNLIVLAAAISGCCTFSKTPATQTYESGYLPIPPLSVKYNISTTQPIDNKRSVILDTLPDTTMRMGVQETTGSINGSYGVGKFNSDGRRFNVILDFTQSTTVMLPLRLMKKPGTATSRPSDVSPNIKKYDDNAQLRDHASREMQLQVGVDPDTEFTYWDNKLHLNDETYPNAPDLELPVYVGVGCRLNADIKTVSGDIDLSSLSTISAAVQAKQAQGTLSLQLLGINGEAITGALTIPQKIDDTTIQNTLVALGVVKAKLYDQQTVITPRIVGIENLLVINSKQKAQIISALLAYESKEHFFVTEQARIETAKNEFAKAEEVKNTAIKELQTNINDHMSKFDDKLNKLDEKLGEFDKKLNAATKRTNDNE